MAAAPSGSSSAPAASTSTRSAADVARAEEMFNTNYCDEEHIEAFARALSHVDDDATALGATVPSSPVSTRSASRHHQPQPHLDPNGHTASAGGNGNTAVPKHMHHTRVRKVSAMSDFAPIHTKVKRGPRRRPRPSIKSEPLYQIFRWPLLILLNTFIAFEFGMYVLIRQLVNLFERTLAWRGIKRRLRSHLRNARSWEEWKTAAAVLDDYLGFNAWKKDDEDPYYDYTLVRKVRRSLRQLRASNDARGLLELLEVCLRDNFAGTQSARLYAETFYGTKDAIEALATEMESALAYIRTSPDLTLEEKRRFYRNANRNLGASALCLSGGASFGFYHFGVLKAFLDANLMPRVFNGTSAGTLAASFACCYTDEELKLLLGPRIADYITCFEEPFSKTLTRLYKEGAMYDAVQWARKSTWFTRGSMTFKEAYERTGKVLNISVVPSDQHSPTKLLNYLTAPNCVIWSAAIASSAVPTIINPVVLMQKTHRGDVVPWNWGTKFKDGSLRVDVPLQSLNLLFNVNYPIVSQVNPHIHLFWFAPRGSAGKPVAHRKGKGWRGGFLLSAAEQFLKLELTKNFKVIRDLELMPQMVGTDWSSVFLQRFDGSVTIHPRVIVRDFFRMLTDPDRTNMERMQRAGELATWPTLHMIENRFRLEREIFRGRLAIRQQSAIARDDLPAPDTDPVHPRLEAGLGAPAPAPSESDTTSIGVNGYSSQQRPSINVQQDNSGTPRASRRSSRSMQSQRSTQLAVESEAEEDFEARSPAIFRSSHSRSGAGLGHTQSHHASPQHSRRGTPAAGNTRGSVTASSSPTATMRRRSSAPLDAMQHDEEDTVNEAGPSRAASSPARSRKASSAAIRSHLSLSGSGSSTPAAGTSSTAAKLISRLRKHTGARFSKYRSSPASAEDDEEDEDDVEFARDRERERAQERRDAAPAPGHHANTLVPDATMWSSDESSFDDPVFDVDASLETNIESHDENMLGLQTSVDTAPRPQSPPQQDR